MHLIYLDESGNTGVDLNDSRQPVFVLGALMVPHDRWLAVESDLTTLVEQFFPSPRPVEFEIHATELVNPRGYFRQFQIQHRLDFFREALAATARHRLKFVYRAIVKKRFSTWLQNTFGAGVLINPHVAAFSLVAQVVQEHLKSLPDAPLGIFISDDNREVAPDVEKSIRILRQDSSTLRLGQIIEKGFFIDSRTSLPLQLCDLCTYAARRKEEQKAGFTVKPIDAHCVSWLEPLVHRGNESFVDVIAWLESQQKKGAARGIAAGPEKVRTTLVAKRNHAPISPFVKHEFSMDSRDPILKRIRPTPPTSTPLNRMTTSLFQSPLLAANHPFGL